jgi:hypothetical protein
MKMNVVPSIFLLISLSHSKHVNTGASDLLKIIFKWSEMHTLDFTTLVRMKYIGYPEDGHIICWYLNKKEVCIVKYSQLKTEKSHYTAFIHDSLQQYCLCMNTGSSKF